MSYAQGGARSRGPPGQVAIVVDRTPEAFLEVYLGLVTEQLPGQTVVGEAFAHMSVLKHRATRAGQRGVLSRFRQPAGTETVF